MPPRAIPPKLREADSSPIQSSNSTFGRLGQKAAQGLSKTAKMEDLQEAIQHARIKCRYKVK